VTTEYDDQRTIFLIGVAFLRPVSKLRAVSNLRNLILIEAPVAIESFLSEAFTLATAAFYKSLILGAFLYFFLCCFVFILQDLFSFSRTTEPFS
jgi:hypothetical protein